MKKIIRLTEKDLTRIVKRVIIEQMEQGPEVSDRERYEFSQKMMKDYIDEYYLDQAINPTTKVPYRLFNVGGKLDYNKVYREYMEGIDNHLKSMGFPNGFNISENITREDFDDLKTKWNQAMEN